MKVINPYGFSHPPSPFRPSRYLHVFSILFISNFLLFDSGHADPLRRTLRDLANNLPNVVVRISCQDFFLKKTQTSRARRISQAFGYGRSFAHCSQLLVNISMQRPDCRVTCEAKSQEDLARQAQQNTRLVDATVLLLGSFWVWI